jgi:hypothetical protein
VSQTASGACLGQVNIASRFAQSQAILPRIMIHWPGWTPLRLHATYAVTPPHMMGPACETASI